MKQFYTLTTFLLFTFISISAQTAFLEDFEDETIHATTFSGNSQNFTITNNNSDTFQIINDGDFGWNGTAVDDISIENAGTRPVGDGTSFSITTTDGTDIVVKSLYIFIAQDDTFSQITNSTLTILAKKDGVDQYTIVKNSGFSNTSSLTPNNGFTFIDFSSAGAADYSNTYVDELVFTTTNDGDYVVLDAFSWSSATLSNNDFDLRTLKVYPNPTFNFITVSGLTETENYTIFDILGKKITKGTISNSEKINVKTLKNGIYFLKFKNANTIKFVKK